MTHVNRLASSHSPYLLQHQHNPVAWYPWGDEAFARARERNCPIFLSVGYAACHWCHVMERESFEDPAIAALMNQHFVCVKVDREERPDVDQLYMTAVQSITGSGGWPMSVFLTPDGRPFFGGTYWPPHSRHGMPGFDRILQAIAGAWHERRAELLTQADALTQHVREILAGPSPETTDDAVSPSLEQLEQAVNRLRRVFDPTHGGFGGAPKFPHVIDLELVLRMWQRTGEQQLREILTRTLDCMAAGGINDHLGGGFARYSVDARWLVPHFEKMLYDNGLLAGIYLRAAQALGRKDYADVARQTLGYIVRDLSDPAGGFHSSEDADSEGEEGKFYVWMRDELQRELGADRGDLFCHVYGVTEEGNFEGHGQNILHLRRPLRDLVKELLGNTSAGDDEIAAAIEQLRQSREHLFHVREQRIRPGRDDKVLASWNGLAIDSLALGGATLQEESFLEAAQRAADFILTTMRGPDQRLLHAFRRGTAHLTGYLEDYAYLLEALVTLVECSGLHRYLTAARELADQLLEHFSAPGGGFYFTAADGEPLLARHRDWLDQSTPSSNASAASALWRLGHLCGEERYLDASRAALHGSASALQHQSAAAAKMLTVLDWQIGPTETWTLEGGPLSERIRATQAFFSISRPRVLWSWNAEAPATSSLMLVRCSGNTCQAPLVDQAAFDFLLGPAAKH
jgi:hypothetical protein